MAQTLPKSCPRCGTPTTAGQRFCANCGLVMDTPLGGSDATAFAPANDDAVHVASHIRNDQSMPQEPPHYTQPYTPSATGGGVAFTPPPQPRRRRSMRRTGLLLALLLVVLLLGAAAYLGSGLVGLHLPGLGAGSQPPITKTQLNTSVTYAGVNLTIQDVQQADSFLDDPNSTSTGMIRLDIQEQNKTKAKVSWLYNAIARLVLVGEKTQAPTYIQTKIGIAPGATQMSKLDFAVVSGTKLSQLTLRLGGAKEAQMDVPLVAHANVSKYAPKTIQPNGQLTYYGLNWTLVSATSQLSIAGQQASTGMIYIVVTLKVDSTLSQQAIPGSPYDYMRLTTGGTTASPKDSTLPDSFDAGETGQTGTVTFLVPQKSSAFTLILLAKDGFDQSTTNFQFS